MQDTPRGSRASRNCQQKWETEGAHLPAGEGNALAVDLGRGAAPHRGALTCEDVTTPAVRSPGRTSSDIGVTCVSVEVEVRAWSVVSTVYDARYDLQAGRLPLRLTRAALDRPRRVLLASFRASAIP